MRPLIIALSFLLVSTAVQAELSDFENRAFKQKNPEELAYVIEVDESCPVSGEQLESTIKSTLVRARIKPLGGTAWKRKKLTLNVSLFCIEREEANPVFKLDIYFGSWSETLPVYYPIDYGTFGIGPVEQLEQSASEGIDRAVTAYLHANFDLGDD